MTSVNSTENTKKKKINSKNGASNKEVLKEDVSVNNEDNSKKAESSEISFLPPEIQSVLVSFKSQLSEAPLEIREVIGKFLFGDKYFNKNDKNQSSLSEEDKKIITATFDDVPLPEGFQNLPPIMIYSASANDFSPIRALAVDVLQWGSRPVIIARSSSSVNVMSSEGKVVKIPPKMVFAILAESDLVGFVRHLNEDPEGSYEIFFAPSCIQKDDSGNSIVRYKVAIGTRVPKSAVWPPK